MWALEVGLGLFGQGIPKYLECGPEGVWGVGRDAWTPHSKGHSQKRARVFQSTAFQSTGPRARATPA